VDDGSQNLDEEEKNGHDMIKRIRDSEWTYVICYSSHGLITLTPWGSFAPSFYKHHSLEPPSPNSSPPLSTLTQPHLAGVGQVVVAGHITPLSLVMPHHDHAVLSRKEVAVRLPRIPVLIELGGRGGQRRW
jgi:hypothetical protein